MVISTSFGSVRNAVQRPLTSVVPTICARHVTTTLIIGNQDLNAEERKAKSDGEKEVKTFRERRTKETEGLLKRLEQDAANKIKHEKRILIDELNHAFLDAVINQARSTISNNEDSQKKATKNLLSEI